METDSKQLGPLDEIADIICSLTYGEMIDLATELWKAAGGAEITAETFPAILHQRCPSAIVNVLVSIVMPPFATLSQGAYRPVSYDETASWQWPLYRSSYLALKHDQKRQACGHG